MDKQKHTPESWEVIKHSRTNLCGGRGQNNDWFVFENALEKDAARIVACVNYCKGTPNEELEAGSLEKLKAERDEMLKEIEKLKANG